MSDKMMRWTLFGSVSAVVLGAAAGYGFPEFMISIDFLGSLFFNALRLIIVPLIVTGLVVGITSLGDVRKVGRTALTTLTYFMATTSIAVILGLALVLLFKPGAGVDSTAAFLPSVVSNLQSYDLGGFITSLIPNSMPQAVIAGNYLGIIVVSVIFSFVLLGLGTKGKQVIDLFETFYLVVFKLVHLLLAAAPVGLFVLMGSIVAQNRDSLGELAAGISGFSAVLLAGFLIHGLIILPLIMRRFTGQSPVSAFTGMLPALATAAGTASSTAALGITSHCVIEKAKVDRRAGSFLLPLGAVINVDATAMYAVIATLFVAQVFGISLSVAQLFLIAITAILASIGLAGLPYGAIFLSVILFGVADFPGYAYAGIGLVFAVDWLFDRLRAVLNIWGDAVGASVIAETFEFKTARTLRTTRSPRVERKYSSRPTGQGARRADRPEQGQRRTDGRSSRIDRDSRPPRDRRDGRAERTDSDRRTSRAPRTRSTASSRDERPAARSRNTRRSTVPGRVAKEQPSPFEMSPPHETAFNVESPAAGEKQPVRKRSMPPPPPLPTFRKAETGKKRITKSGNTENPKAAKDRPAEDAVERELSKVAAQLASLDGKSQADTVSESNDKGIEKSDDSLARIDFLAGENGTVTPVPEDEVEKEAAQTSEPLMEEKSEASEPSLPKENLPEDKPESEASAGDPEPDQPVRQFGRSRTGRTSRPKKETDPPEKAVEPSEEAGEAPVEPAEEPVLAKDAYKSENQSFGRAKKKRVR